ncbi:hypothetical protein AB7952_02120 [Streptomyces sp. PG2]
MPDLVPRAEPPPRLSPDRWWRWRRGPLRRPGDLLLAWAGLLLGLLAAAAAPLTGYLVGAAVYEGTTDSARARLEGGEHTTAVVLRHVPRHPEPGSEEERETRYPAAVRYTAADGSVRTATTEVEPGLAAGERVRVWTDAAGEVVKPPPGEKEIRSRAVGAGISAGVGVPLLAWLVYAAGAGIVRRRADGGVGVRMGAGRGPVDVPAVSHGLAAPGGRGNLPKGEKMIARRGTRPPIPPSIRSEAARRTPPAPRGLRRAVRPRSAVRAPAGPGSGGGENAGSPTPHDPGRPTP